MSIEENDDKSHDILISCTCFFLSVILNGGAMISFDQAFSAREQLMTAERLARIAKRAQIYNFEFVEAPPVSRPEKPLASRKMSDRDSVSQDLFKKKFPNSRLPRVKKLGIADQLAQKPGPPAVIPVAPVQPAPPPKPPAPVAEKPEAPKYPSERLSPPKPAPPIEPVPQAIKDVTLPTSQVVAAPKEKPVEEQPEDKISLEKIPPKPKETVSTSPPQPAVVAKKGEGLTGRDKIITQEMSRSSSRGGRFMGMTSFEATGSGMGVYMKNLKERVWLAWFPYLIAKYPLDYRTADVVLSITLSAKGEVKNVQVLESQGSPLFAAFCVEAIQKASGFGPLPKEILALVGKDELEIKFGFHYR